MGQNITDRIHFYLCPLPLSEVTLKVVQKSTLILAITLLTKEVVSVVQVCCYIAIYI